MAFNILKRPMSINKVEYTLTDMRMGKGLGFPMAALIKWALKPRAVDPSDRNKTKFGMPLCNQQ